MKKMKKIQKSEFFQKSEFVRKYEIFQKIWFFSENDQVMEVIKVREVGIAIEVKRSDAGDVSPVFYLE